MFEIGEMHAWACCLWLAAGAAAALALGGARARRAGVGWQSIARLTALLPLSAAVGSHLLYTLVSWESALYGRTPLAALAFWEPGYMLYGGIAGVLVALALAARRERASLWNAYAPALACMLIFARLAEGAAGQGYGEYAEEVGALCRFPFMVYDPYYEAWAWALFVAEALVALALLMALSRLKPRFAGDGMLLLLGLYACAQIVLESLRRDEFLRWGFVRVEELFSAATILLTLLGYLRRAGRGCAARKAACLGVYALLVTLCVLLEFATEGRIPFLRFLQVNQCYAVMAAACAGLGGCVLWMRRICLRKECEKP